MRIENVFVMISSVCFFLSIYFAILSLYAIVDEPLRVQLLAMATSFFIGGAVIAILFAIVKIVACAR